MSTKKLVSSLRFAKDDTTPVRIGYFYRCGYWYQRSSGPGYWNVYRICGPNANELRRLMEAYREDDQIV